MKDCKDEKVHLGDTIDFTFWYYCGYEQEIHRIGKLQRTKKGIAFIEKSNYQYDSQGKRHYKKADNVVWMLKELRYANDDILILKRAKRRKQ